MFQQPWLSKLGFGNCAVHWTCPLFVAIQILSLGGIAHIVASPANSCYMMYLSASLCLEAPKGVIDFGIASRGSCLSEERTGTYFPLRQLGVEKGQVTSGEYGSKTPKQPKHLQNNGKPNKTITGLITWIGLRLD